MFAVPVMSVVYKFMREAVVKRENNQSVKNEIAEAADKNDVSIDMVKAKTEDEKLK